MNFTKRQLEIMDFWLNGYGDKKIAKRLKITRTNVCKHRVIIIKTLFKVGDNNEYK